jgi:hypothetical protein
VIGVRQQVIGRDVILMPEFVEQALLRHDPPPLTSAFNKI